VPPFNQYWPALAVDNRPWFYAEIELIVDRH
jgi:hypothetical protein